MSTGFPRAVSRSSSRLSVVRSAGAGIPQPAVERDAASPVDAVASIEDAVRAERTASQAQLPRQFAASAVASRLMGSRRPGGRFAAGSVLQAPARVAAQPLAARAKPVSTGRLRPVRSCGRSGPGASAEMRAYGDKRVSCRRGRPALHSCSPGSSRRRRSRGCMCPPRAVTRRGRSGLRITAPRHQDRQSGGRRRHCCSCACSRRDRG